jgi:hypothetical protein
MTMLMWRNLSGTSIVACLDSLLSTLDKANASKADGARGADKDAGRATGDESASPAKPGRDEKTYPSSNI